MLFTTAPAGTTSLIFINPTWGPTTANSSVLYLNPILNGSANGVQGLTVAPEFQPSAGITACYANLSIAVANPPTGVTISQIGWWVLPY